jgi:hypothetical protein
LLFESDGKSQFILGGLEQRNIISFVVEVIITILLVVLAEHEFTAERERVGRELGQPTGNGAPMLIGFVDVELQSVTANPQRDVINAIDETLRQRFNVTGPTKAADLAVVGVEVWRKSVPLDDCL